MLCPCADHLYRQFLKHPDVNRTRSKLILIISSAQDIVLSKTPWIKLIALQLIIIFQGIWIVGSRIDCCDFLWLVSPQSFHFYGLRKVKNTPQVFFRSNHFFLLLLPSDPALLLLRNLLFSLSNIDILLVVVMSFISNDLLTLFNLLLFLIVDIHLLCLDLVLFLLYLLLEFLLSLLLFLHHSLIVFLCLLFPVIPECVSHSALPFVILPPTIDLSIRCQSNRMVLPSIKSHNIQSI